MVRWRRFPPPVAYTVDNGRTPGEHRHRRQFLQDSWFAVPGTMDAAAPLPLTPLAGYHIRPSGHLGDRHCAVLDDVPLPDHLPDAGFRRQPNAAAWRRYWWPRYDSSTCLTEDVDRSTHAENRWLHHGHYRTVPQRPDAGTHHRHDSAWWTTTVPLPPFSYPLTFGQDLRAVHGPFSAHRPGGDSCAATLRRLDKTGRMLLGGLFGANLTLPPPLLHTPQCFCPDTTAPHGTFPPTTTHAGTTYSTDTTFCGLQRLFPPHVGRSRNTTNRDVEGLHCHCPHRYGLDVWAGTEPGRELAGVARGRPYAGLVERYFPDVDLVLAAGTTHHATPPVEQLLITAHLPAAIHFNSLWAIPRFLILDGLVHPRAATTAGLVNGLPDPPTTLRLVADGSFSAYHICHDLLPADRILRGGLGGVPATTPPGTGFHHGSTRVKYHAPGTEADW